MAMEDKNLTVGEHAVSGGNVKLNLLIVDDDNLLVNSLAEIFCEFGHDVRTAADGLTALRQMRDEVPDVLLSDLYMPGMSGFELLSVVRRRFPAIQVIAMSSAFQGSRVPAEIAADGYYEKAAKFGTLLDLVAEMAGHMHVPERHARGMETPMWVARNWHHPTGEPYVMLSCAECLRTFPQVLEADVRKVASTGCTHCSAPMEYAVVHPFENRQMNLSEQIPGAVLTAEKLSV